MPHLSAPDDLINFHPATGPLRRGRPSSRAPRASRNTLRIPVPTSELASRTFVAFRAHPHINNVLTHISHGNWGMVEQSLNAILNRATTGNSLSPLAQNIVELMCADRGITGRILKPCFHAVLHRALEPDQAERLIRHVRALFVELEQKTQRGRARRR